MAMIIGEGSGSSNSGKPKDFEAQGFINGKLPLPNGKHHQLKAITLRVTKDIEALIIERLKEGGQDALDAMMSKVKWNFVAVEESSVKSANDLGF